VIGSGGYSRDHRFVFCHKRAGCWTETAPLWYVQGVSTLEEIKAATQRLKPDEQEELFNWWVQTDAFKARQLAGLKRDLAVGLEQLEQGRYRTYDDTSVMQLAEDVGRSGRERLKRGSKTSPS
jgi:hypothetical protein